MQLLNFYSSWYSLRNCLEYFFWFRSRLHLQAEKGFITLGGNTVFIKRELVEPPPGSDAQWGWDDKCLAEDCELGVRLSSAGKKVVVAYSPEMVTREETPDTLKSFVKQRTRWNQGFLQVYRKGDWRQLPTRRQRCSRGSPSPPRSTRRPRALPSRSESRSASWPRCRWWSR